jgi:hypothetical protein
VTTRPLTIRLRSTNPSVLVVDSSFYHVPVGGYQLYARYRAVGAGQARLIMSDSAGIYAADSTNITTVTAAPLAFSTSLLKMGMRQMVGDSAISGQYPLFVTVPNAVTGSPLVITLTSSDTRVATAPATVTIPVGSTRTSVRITTHDVVGSISILASTPGFFEGRVDVDVTRPKFIVQANSTGTAGQRSSLYIDLADSTGVANQTTENIVVTLRSSNPAVVALDSASITIPAGANRSAVLSNVVRWVSAGTATITATDERTGAVVYATGTRTVTVSNPAIRSSSVVPAPQTNATPPPRDGRN